MAIEVVTGTQVGKPGSFVLKQFGTVDKNGPKRTGTIVPESGADELKEIARTFRIKIEGGMHHLDVEYILQE